jgi:two-component system, LuxR family, sensor kinase FixL
MTAANDAARRIFGYRTDELLGENVNMLMPEPDCSAHSGYIDAYLSTQVPRVIGKGRDVIGRRKSGECFPARLSIGQIPDCLPPQFVGFVRDTTEQALREEESRVVHERLTSVSRLATLGEMAAGIAHKLNQPLTAINVYARACERFIDMPQPDIAELRAAVREISAEALRAGAIIHRMRQLVRMDAFEGVPVDVSTLIDGLKVLIAADARIHGTHVRYTIASGDIRVKADAIQLQQLLLNLTRNAFEALATQASEPRVLEIATMVVPGGELEISVSDNGPGVAAAIAGRLFEPFCTTKPGGTGLGLAISRTIAQSHGGTVGNRPVSPHGTCFYVRLPVLEGSAT